MLGLNVDLSGSGWELRGEEGAVLEGLWGKEPWDT